MPLLKRLGSLVLHPFLLAAVAVLSARVQVKLEVLPEEVWAPLLLMEAWALFVFLAFWAYFKDHIKAGVASSFVVCLSLTFDTFRNFVNSIWVVVFHDTLEDMFIFFFFWIIIFGLLSLLFRKPPLASEGGADAGKKSAAKPVDFGRMNVAFNIMCTILLAINMAPVVVSDIEQQKVHEHFIQMFQAPFQSVRFKTANAAKPDVYYIILDAYASPFTMKEMGGYDDKEFLDFLKAHGFYVVPRAASNYDRTPFSISSSLNMDYINAVPKEMGDNFVADNIFYRLMQNSAVVTMFRKLGYKFINVSSGAFATDYIAGADANIKSDFGNHFTTAMMMLTPLLGVEKYFHIMRDGYCNRRDCPGRCLDQVLPMPGPKFVLIHTDLSHPPPLFARDGTRRELPRELLNDHSTDFGAYVEQIRFCNSEVEKWIEKIDSAPGPKPVIIVQADHGVYYPMKTDDAYYNEVMRILNAYRFPGDKNHSYYPTVTPVNSFRILFNDYFGAGLPLLKDQSWCSPLRVRPYSWSDVTSRLKFPEAEPTSQTGQSQ